MREILILKSTSMIDCTNIEVYDKEIFIKYSKEEIDKANSMIDHGP